MPAVSNEMAWFREGKSQPLHLVRKEIVTCLNGQKNFPDLYTIDSCRCKGKVRASVLCNSASTSFWKGSSRNQTWGTRHVFVSLWTSQNSIVWKVHESTKSRTHSSLKNSKRCRSDRHFTGCKTKPRQPGSKTRRKHRRHSRNFLENTFH